MSIHTPTHNCYFMGVCVYACVWVCVCVGLFYSNLVLASCPNLVLFRVSKEFVFAPSKTLWGKFASLWELFSTSTPQKFF